VSEPLYDSIAILFSVLAIRSLYQKKSASGALFWFGVASFLHFRALWFFPVGLAAAYLSLREWKNALRRDRIRGVVGAVLLATSVVSLVIAYPRLGDSPLNNRFHYSLLGSIGPIQIGTLILGLILGGLFFVTDRGHRRWVSLLSILCALTFLLGTRQVMFWHELSWMPLLIMAVLGAHWREIRLVAAFGWVLLLSTYHYGTQPLISRFFHEAQKDYPVLKRGFSGDSK